MPSIEDELDERHRAAKQAFEARDLGAYRALFAPGLAWRRADGQVIGRDELMRDVARQFRALSHATSSFNREHLTVTGDDVTETLTQHATLGATAFAFIHRDWTLDRRGDYTWTKIDGLWTIARVEIASQTLTHTGWRLGLR